jgi:hypothetical protein
MIALVSYLCKKAQSMQSVQSFFIFILVLFVSGCGASEKETAEQKAWDYMMSIHDEVMPRMSEINSLAKSVEAIIADGTLGAEIKTAAEQRLEALSQADNAMWDWMYALKQLPQLRQEGNHEETMKYIGRETVRIADVKTLMIQSIEDARIFVSQNAKAAGQ